MRLTGPCAHHLDGGLACPTIMGAARRLSIDGDLLGGQDRVDGLDPREETGLKLLWVQSCKDAAKGIMRGNAIGQIQKPLQPGSFRFAKFFDLYPGVGSTN